MYTPLFAKLKTLASGTLKVAFVHEKDAESSAWTYSHELGRAHIEQKFGSHIATHCFDNIKDDEAEDVIEQIIRDKYDIIFTTSPQLMIPSLRAAINHPDKKILNCSLNTSHRYIRDILCPALRSKIYGRRYRCYDVPHRKNRLHRRLSDLRHGGQYQRIRPWRQTYQPLCQNIS